ncbi:MAG: GMC family oxidoreductase [Anaerolineae bacterium]|nr:GMC family oxidoreductase [Anaerolineae bacterium]
MIIDLNEVLSDPFAEKEIDVCICGAGVAGITLALNLSRKLNVLLLEGGGFEFSADSQSVYQGESVGQQYTPLSATRLRYLGGASNHWGGWCRPLDSYDFEPKDTVQDSGWPIRRADLDPYLEKTESILDLSDNDDWHQPGDTIGKKIDATRAFQTFNFKWSNPPTRFGQKYRKEIERRSNVFCYLNANVTELHLTENLSRLQRINVRNYSGKIFQVPAQIFILAAGGIENPRILLNSNHQVPAGLGNRNGLVGQYFADHLHATAGEFILEDPMREYLEENWFEGSFKARLEGLICGSRWAGEWVRKIPRKKKSCVSQAHRMFFSPSLEFIERDRILNFGLRFLPYEPGTERATDGVLTIESEQALNPLSRITLAPEVDQFGMRRVKLDWQLSAIDLHTIQRAVFRFGQTFADLDLGRVRVADWLRSDPPKFTGEGGNHHMCTTRMAETPDKGVVDQHQRVFGTDNLYVAGSGVFSSTGHANPTFTIVQMTLRLADHISMQAKKNT